MTPSAASGSGPRPPLENFALLLPGGGASSRFGSENKLLAMLDALPVFLHSIRTLAPLFPQNAVFIAVPEKLLEKFRAAAQRFLPEIPVRFLPGGPSRMDSVSNLLGALKPGTRNSAASPDFIAIHDAARPLVSASSVLLCAEICRKTSAAILARKVTDTLKESAPGAPQILRSLPRETLWRAETPQMFRLDAFRAALDRAIAAGENTLTDDSQIMERFSAFPVTLVPDENLNPKITAPGDLLLCKALLAATDERGL